MSNAAKGGPAGGAHSLSSHEIMKGKDITKKQHICFVCDFVSFLLLSCEIFYIFRPSGLNDLNEAVSLYCTSFLIT